MTKNIDSYYVFLYNQQYRMDHKDYFREYSKNYNEKHKEQLNEYRKNYYKKKKYLLKNKDPILEVVDQKTTIYFN